MNNDHLLESDFVNLKSLVLSIITNETIEH